MTHEIAYKKLPVEKLTTAENKLRFKELFDARCADKCGGTACEKDAPCACREWAKDRV